MISKNMHAAYRQLLLELETQGDVELNARTGTCIKMLRGAWAFRLDTRPGLIPVPGNRKYFPHVAAAEVAWQLLGTKDPSFIMRHAPKIWGKFLEEGELKTAYGHRWRSHFGRDQLALAVDELRHSPSNRQLYVSAWDPSCDGLGGLQPRNIPCPVGFAVSRYRDELHMSVHMRSSDVFVGLPYDVMGYALMSDAIAASVGCVPSTLTFTLAHAHLYEPHWDMNRACTIGGLPSCMKTNRASTTWTQDCEPNMPGWNIDQIVDDPDGYVDVVKTLSRRVNSNSWNPTPEVIV